MTSKTLGENGFRWFIGNVVDRKSDPQKLGRVRVRIYGVHDESSTTPDEELPWATIINPPQSASANQVGVAPLGIMEGSVVVGFFADGAEGQLPMILGTIAGIPNNDVSRHDVAKLAREENDLEAIKNERRITGGLITEPDTPYGAKYPYNKVVRTESGHTFEIDDTPDNERLHLFHKTGTYVEIDKNGKRVDKIVANNYTIVASDNHVYVGGDCFLEVEGKSIVVIKNNSSIRVEGDCNISTGGVLNISSDERIVMKAPFIHFNPNTVATVTSSVELDLPPSTPGLNTAAKAKFAGFVQPNVTRSRYGG